MEERCGRTRPDAFGKGPLLQEAMKACLKILEAVLHPAQGNILIARSCTQHRQGPS